MNILLWVLQVLLALAFLAHGWLMLTPPAEIADADERRAPALVSALSSESPKYWRRWD